MAQKNNNQKKKQNDYFSQNIQQYGENFLQYKNARDLEMDSIKVFRGLARGNINIDRYGCYFLDPQFLNACIQTAYSKKVYFGISYDGVNYYKDAIFASGYTPDPNIIMILDHHKKCLEAYTIIYDNLQNIRNTGDVNYLVCLANSLADYRNYV